MNFLRRVSRLTLKDRVRSSDDEKELKTEVTLEVVWVSGEDGSWTRRLEGTSNLEETHEQTQNMLVGLYILSGLKTSWDTPSRSRNVALEGDIWATLISHHDTDPDKLLKMDRWMKK